MGVDQWSEEPSSWDYVLTPAFLMSFIVTLALPLILSPLACGILVQQSKNVPAKRQTHFHTLSSSTVHAVTVSVLAVYLLVSGTLGPTRVFSKSSVGFIALQISLGYFIGDFIVSLLDPTLRSDVGSIIHHLAGITSISIGLVHQGKLMFFIVYRLISELSTPMVNLRLFHYQLDNKNGCGYSFASLGMMVTFFLFRIAPIPWHWFVLIQTLNDPLCPVVVELQGRIWLVGIYIIFDVLNLYWFSKVIKVAMKVYVSRKVK